MNSVIFSILILTIVLIGVSIYIAVLWWLDRKIWNKERRDLLDRLMARTFGEYMAGKRTEAEFKKGSTITVDELLKRVEEEQRASDIISIP